MTWWLEWRCEKQKFQIGLGVPGVGGRNCAEVCRWVGAVTGGVVEWKQRRSGTRGSATLSCRNTEHLGWSKGRAAWVGARVGSEAQACWRQTLSSGREHPHTGRVEGGR